MTAATRRRFRRTPRRRLHALHADILLVLALAAALAAALPAMRTSAPERPVPGGFAVVAGPADAAPGGFSSPVLFAFGDGTDPERASLPAVPEPPEAELARRPAWEPPAVFPDPDAGSGADGEERPAPPVASLLAGLTPATPLFSEPRPAPDAPPDPGPVEPLSVERFRSAPDAPPVAIVDAPGADAARLRELEAAAYAEGR